MTISGERYGALDKDSSIIFECVTGSQVCGTAIETSDTDKKFIYCESLDNILSDQLRKQINISKDYVGYEIERFLELLFKSSPNIIEMLFTPSKFVITEHPLFKKYIINNRNSFLTKQIYFSFGQYAKEQISKARNVKRKVITPMDPNRKDILDFCYVFNNSTSVLIKDFVNTSKYYNNVDIDLNKCGCSSVPHIKDCYLLFQSDENQCFDGIVSKDMNSI